jgi:hypothetical protein
MRRKWKVKLKNINWGFNLNEPLYGVFPKEDEVVVEESCIQHLDTFDPNDFGPWEDEKEHDDPCEFGEIIIEELYRKYPSARSDHFVDFDVADMTLLEEHDRIALSGYFINGEWKVELKRNLPGQAIKKPLVDFHVHAEAENVDGLKKALSELVDRIGRHFGSNISGDLMICGIEAIKGMSK